jgi:2-deoxystreptamine N-acetyl-D-glucosaminyltransferase/2-deoxystreptamine glucosyltransferase
MKNAPKKWRVNENIEVCAANIPVIPIRSRVRGTVGLNVYWGLGVILKVVGISFKSIFKQSERYDIIHSHCSGVAAPLVVGLISKWILRKPLVYTVHCCRIGTYEPMNRLDKLINKYIIKIEEICLTQADSIVVLTERTKNLIANEYPSVKKGRIYVIPDMISVESYRKSVTSEKIEDFYNTFNIPKDKKIVTYAGRIAHEKGWSYLVEAISLLNREDIYFIFCGDGNERRELDKLIENKGLKDRVIVTGFISNETVAVGLHISDAIVIPSVHEELGSVFLEAASMKKPVIASAVGGLTENIKDGISGILVPAKSPEKIAEKIKYLLDNKEIGEMLGIELYKSVVDKFDVTGVCGEMNDCYKDTMKSFLGSEENVSY